MQINDIYEQREPKRVVIPSSKLESIRNKNDNKHHEENSIVNEKGISIAIEYIYNKKSKEEIAKKYSTIEKNVILCVSLFGDKISKYLNDDRYISLIEKIHSYTPFEKKLAIIVDFFENNLFEKEITSKYGLSESNTRGVILAYKQQSKEIKEIKFINKIRAYQKPIISDGDPSYMSSENKDLKMDKKKEKFLAILNDHKATGVSFIKLAEKHGILYQTLMNWKKKYGDVEIKNPEYNETPSKYIKNEHIISISKDKFEYNRIKELESKNKDLESEIIRLKKIVDHLIK